MSKLRLPPGTMGQRLDTVLAGQMPQFSRATWQKLIKNGQIHADGKVVNDPSTPVSSLNISFELPQHQQAPKNAVEVLYKDRDVVVFNKPSGVLTHAKGQLEPEWTLVDVARPYIEDDGTNRPGIVHRLDRDTSGVILIARHARAKQFLQKQFVNRRVFKRYIALVEGLLPNEHYSLSWPLSRDAKRPSVFKVDPAGKEARTEVSVISRQGQTTLVALIPATGRTHQLRVHLKHLGHPILGDRIYGSAESARRLMLHAERLKLNLPSQAQNEFIAPPGKDFNEEFKLHER